MPRAEQHPLPRAPWPRRSRSALLAAGVALLAALAPATARAADPPAGPGGLQAKSWVLVEPTTGDVVAARSPDVRRPIASTTKLMTALLALEAWDDLSEDVEVVSYAAAAAESTAGLQAGERLSRADLLRALLLASANEAAATIAERVGGSESAFVDRMNARAEELGLSARYRNPVGLDAAGARASATDLVRLTEVLRRRAFFRETTDEPEARLRTGAVPRTVVNRNALVREVPWVDGVKTGRTRQAGYVLVSSGRRAGVPMIAAVLGDPSEAARDADSLALLRYGMARYARRSAVREGAVLARRPLRFRERGVALVAGAGVRRVARDGEALRTRVVGLPADVEGPLPRGARLGTAEVLQRGEVVARVPVRTAAAVPAAGVRDRADDVLGSPLGLALLLAIVGCAVALVAVPRLVPGAVGFSALRPGRGVAAGAGAAPRGGAGPPGDDGAPGGAPRAGSAGPSEGRASRPRGGPTGPPTHARNGSAADDARPSDGARARSRDAAHRPTDGAEHAGQADADDASHSSGRRGGAAAGASELARRVATAVRRRTAERGAERGPGLDAGEDDDGWGWVDAPEAPRGTAGTGPRAGSEARR